MGRAVTISSEAAGTDGALSANIQSRLPSGKALSDESLAIVQQLLNAGASQELAVNAAARLGLLEHRLRCAEYERESALTQKRQIVERHAAQEKPTQAMVERLWGLIDHRRKTLSMKALHEALMGAPGGAR